MDTRVVFATSHDGVRVAAGVGGSGFPLVHLVMPLFSHALLPPRPSEPFIRRMEARHRLIRIDLRGCGLADWDPPSHTLDDYPSDIIAVLDALGIERTDVVAFGGRTPAAVRLAVRFPERVRRLYLRGVAVGANGADGRPFFGSAARQLSMEDWHLFLETVASRTLRAESHAAAYADRMAKCTDPKNLLAAHEALDAADVAQDVCALRCPTLVVELEDNALIERGQPERFIALAPHAQLRYVPNTPGWLDDFAAVIEDFDAELDAGSESSRDAVTLSQREAQVLNLLASGHTNAEIASTLTLSKSTVDRHVANIYAKINVRNRAEATRWALKHGIDQPS